MGSGSEFVIPIATYIATAKQGEAAFLEAHPDPVLVIEPFMALDETGFQTIMGVKSSSQDERVAPLRKREQANQFGYMITIGRAGNNDLVVRYQGISKFHAYVMLGAPGPRIVDAGSTNGTTVAGTPLAPRGEPALLESGTILRLADLKAVYFEAEAFFEHLQRTRL